MKDRIKKIRKELNLTQQKFADRIGVKQNTVAQYEMGRNVPIDSVISLICLEFNVNEDYLRNGTEPIFIQNDNSLLQQISAEYNLDDFQTKMIEKFLKLDDFRRKAISDYIKSLIEEHETRQEKVSVIKENEKFLRKEEPKTVRLLARGGYYDVEDTEERRAAFKKDMEEDYEYNPNDF